MMFLQVSSMHSDIRLKVSMPSEVKSPVSERFPLSEPNGRSRMRIALFGFGTVGSSVARILLESKPESLQITHVYNRNVARKRADWVPANVVWSENWEEVLASD